MTNKEIFLSQESLLASSLNIGDMDIEEVTRLAISCVAADLLGKLPSRPSRGEERLPEKTRPGHLRKMLLSLLKKELPSDKASRWLGYCQGVLAAQQRIDVDQEQAETRPVFKLLSRLGGSPYLNKEV